MAEGDKQPSEQKLSIFEALDLWCGERYDRQVAARLQNLPNEQRHSLVDAVSDAAMSPELEPVELGEVRPMFHDLRVDDGIEPDALKTFLLFAHSVLVVAPIGTNLRMPGLANKTLRFLAELRPLYDVGALSLIERGGTPQRKGLVELARELASDKSLTNVQRYLDEAARRRDEASVAREAVAARIQAVDDDLVLQLFRLHPREMSAKFLSSVQVLDMLELAAGRWADISFKDSAAQQVYEVGLLPVASSVTDLRLRYVREAFRCPPLNLSALTFRDIVTLRKNDESLAQWHDGLRGALVAAAGVTGEERWSETVRAVVADALRSQSTHLGKTLSKHGLVTALRGGVSAFSLSALGTGASGLMGSKPIPALAGAATTATATAAIAYLRTLRQRKGNSALLAHYAAFTPPD